MNLDRFHLLEENNKRVFTETQNILSKYNIKLNDDNNRAELEYILFYLL